MNQTRLRNTELREWAEKNIHQNKTERKLSQNQIFVIYLQKKTINL